MSKSAKTLLVLGASRYQLDVIRAAKALGCRVITTDNRPDNPGHRLADAAFSVDTTDVDGILRLAKSESISGILAPCTDVAMPALARVAHVLGLVGPPQEAIAVCCDKPAFRRWSNRVGLPTPVFADSPEGFRHPFPAIVKPAKASGSRGVRVVNGPDELSAAWDAARAEDLRGNAIVESFHDGIQVTCEGFLHEGQIVWSLLTERETAPLPHVATWGHLAPAPADKNACHQLLAMLESAWQMLGFRTGFFDADFVLTPNGPLLIEMSPRLGGNAILTLAHACSRADLATHSVLVALGETPAPPPRNTVSPHAIVLFGSMCSGTLDYSERDLTALHGLKGVRSLSMDYPPGTPIQPFTDGRRRFGHALVSGSTAAVIRKRRAALRQHLQSFVKMDFASPHVPLHFAGPLSYPQAMSGHHSAPPIPQPHPPS